MKLGLCSKNVSNPRLDELKVFYPDVLLISSLNVSNFFSLTFSQISIYAGDKARASKFASVGVDGRFVVWDVKVGYLGHSCVGPSVLLCSFLSVWGVVNPF